MKYLSAGVYYVCAFAAWLLRGLTALALLVIEFFWPLFWTGVVLGLFALLFAASAHEAKQWAQFKVDHKCRVTQEMQGDLNVGVTTTTGQNGYVSVSPVITTSPDKVGWLCDDGITYWKSK